MGRTVDGSKESKRWDEGHFYAECSNKGMCNRKSGECECFPGYTGAGCKRTTCPGLTDDGHECNGHGACIKAYDDVPTYHLWDKEKTMKCKCGKGFEGPDCSMRKCMANADPVEDKDTALSTVTRLSFSSFFFPILALNNINHMINGDVLFAITVEDEWGESWTTNAITMRYETLCGSSDGTVATVWCEMTPKLRVEYDSNKYAKGYNPNQKTVADQVNMSLASLANDAITLPQIWQEYTTTA